MAKCMKIVFGCFFLYSLFLLSFSFYMFFLLLFVPVSTSSGVALAKKNNNNKGNGIKSDNNLIFHISNFAILPREKESATEKWWIDMAEEALRCCQEGERQRKNEWKSFNIKRPEWKIKTNKDSWSQLHEGCSNVLATKNCHL